MNDQVYFLVHAELIRGLFQRANHMIICGISAVALMSFSHPARFVLSGALMLIGLLLLMHLGTLLRLHLSRELRVAAKVSPHLYLGACAMSFFLVYLIVPMVKFPIGHPECAIEARGLTTYFSWQDELRWYVTTAHHSYQHRGKAVCFDTEYDGGILDFHREFGSSEAFADSSNTQVRRFADEFFAVDSAATIVSLALRLKEGLPGMRIRNVALMDVPRDETYSIPIASAASGDFS
ncbi:MAG: hypothetical protein V1685_04855 [Parcubacteria group bacterium]